VHPKASGGAWLGLPQSPILPPPVTAKSSSMFRTLHNTDNGDEV